MEYLYGILDLSFWGYVLAAFVMVQITMMAVTLYLHRDQAHRAIDLHPALRHFFRFWIWCTSGMLTREWVAVHRKHHAFCETEGDPHSPQIFGLKKVLLEGAELYREEKDKPEGQPTPIEPSEVKCGGVIAGLAEAAKDKVAIALSHCDAAKLVVNPQRSNPSIDPGDDAPTGATSKNPLIVVAPAPRQTDGEKSF